MQPPDHPTLIYDGDCAFCTRWAGRCVRMSDGAIEAAPARVAGERFAGIPRSRFDESVVLVEPGGEAYFGAEAIFRALAKRSRGPWRWPLFVYRHVPGVRPLCEWAYRVVAARRHRH